MSKTWEESIAAAGASGHSFEADPTHGLSAVARITCVNCDDSILNYQGNVYGAATERTCADAQASNRRLDEYLEGRRS